MAVDVQDRRGADADRERADRRDRLQSGRPFADGRAPRERPRDARAHSAAVRHLVSRARRFPTASCPTISTFRPTGACCPARWPRSTATSSCACGSSRSSWRGREAALRVPLRAVGPGELRVFARRPLPVRQQLLHGRVQHLPLRGRHRRVEAVSNAETGFFRPVPLADGRLVVLNYTGEGFVPAIIDPRPIETSARSRSSARELAAKYPVVKTWQVRAAERGRRGKADHAEGPVRSAAQASRSSNAYPVLQGYKNSAGIGYHFNFDDPLQFASLGITAAYTPSSNLPGDERGHVDITGRYQFWTRRLSWNRSDFYDLFGPTKRSRKGYAAKLGYDWELYLRRAAQAGPASRFRLLRPDRHAAERAERRDQLHPARHRRGRAPLHRRASARSAPSTTRKASPGHWSTTGSR